MKNDYKFDEKVLLSLKKDRFNQLFSESVMDKIYEQEAVNFSLIEKLEHKIFSYKMFFATSVLASTLFFAFFGVKNLGLLDTMLNSNSNYSLLTIGNNENQYSFSFGNDALFHSEFIEHELSPYEDQCSLVRDIIKHHTNSNINSNSDKCKNTYNILKSMKEEIMPILTDSQREKLVSKIYEFEDLCC